MATNSEFMMLPINCIKTDCDSDQEDAAAAVVSAAECNNEVLLENNVKLEPLSESIVPTEDPLNIQGKLEMKIEIGDTYMGEYDETVWLNAETTDGEQRPPLADGTAAPSRSKRARKDSTVRWSNQKPLNITLEVANANKTLPPKGKGPAKMVANTLEAWQLLLDVPILQSIVKHTNEEIKRRRGKSLPNTRSTDLIELYAWLGLNYLCGIFCRSDGATLEELWTPELGVPIFRATMTLRRFEFLGDCLQLSEFPPKSKSTTKREQLQALCGIWDKFIINCRSYYAPSGNCTLHEHKLPLLVPAATKSSSSSSAWMPNEASSNIRLISLHDAKTLYMCNGILSHSVSVPAVKEELFTLVCDVKGTHRNLTLPPRYTSLSLAEPLLQSQLTLVGELSAGANLNDLPTVVKCSMYSGALSIIPSVDGTAPPLLTGGISPLVDGRKLYDATQGAGARFFATAAKYSTSAAYSTSAPRQDKRRPQLQLLHTLLDFACTNAWLLLRLSTHSQEAAAQHEQQRDFQRQLGLFLTQQLLKRRLHRNVKLPLPLKLTIGEILGEPPDELLADAVSAAARTTSAGTMPAECASLPCDIQLLPKTTPKRARCRKCPSKIGSKTRWQCQQCARALCHNHLILRCDDCTGIKNAPPENGQEEDAYFK